MIFGGFLELKTKKINKNARPVSEFYSFAMFFPKAPHEPISESLFNSRSICYRFSITNQSILGDVTMQDEACVTNMVNIKRNEAEMANPGERFL